MVPTSLSPASILSRRAGPAFCPHGRGFSYFARALDSLSVPPQAHPRWEPASDRFFTLILRGGFLEFCGLVLDAFCHWRLQGIVRSGLPGTGHAGIFFFGFFS